MGLIITPDDPSFYATLHSALPPGWRDSVDSDFKGYFAVRSDSLLLQPMTVKELDEYLEDGEYDELEWLDEDGLSC